MRMDGRAAVVTGATTGLGRDAAPLLAEEGAGMVAAGRDEANGRSLEGEAAGLPGEVAFPAGDVRDEAIRDGAVAPARERLGRLDADVDTAGILGPEGPLHETGPGWRATAPIGRVARPREVASAMPSPASEEASFATGAHLLVDGALTAKSC